MDWGTASQTLASTAGALIIIIPVVYKAGMIVATQKSDIQGLKNKDTFHEEMMKKMAETQSYLSKTTNRHDTEIALVQKDITQHKETSHERPIA